MKPPSHIDAARVLEWAWSEEAFGSVHYSDGGGIAAVIHGLALCQYDGSTEVYRFSCDRAWECWHPGTTRMSASARRRAGARPSRCLRNGGP